MALGTDALMKNTDRSNLVAIGDSALFNNGTGTINVLEARRNTAVGSKALYTNTTGYQNTATGNVALILNSTGIYNTANGSFSLSRNTQGNYNTGMGSETLFNTTTGNNNTAIGYSSLYYNITGNNNTAIGYGADVSNNNITNATAIGANAKVALSNSLILGGLGVDAVNVGIGISVPGYPLNFATTLGNKISLYGTSGNHYGFGVQSGLLQIHSDVAASDIVFGYGSSTSLTENMRIKGNGNVGIGTNNPVKPLSFPALLGEKILLYPGGAGEVGIGVYGNELRLHADNPGAAVSFGTQDNFGTFTQAGRFQISGAYGLFVNGSIWANGTTYASDQRFKKNITAIETPLQKLLQINGVEYEMQTNEFSKNNFMKGRQIGLLAQNVEQVVPEAVHEKDGYKGVDYARLVPLLIEAMKEQNKKIDLQQIEINNLKIILNR